MSYNTVLVELLEHIARRDKHVLIGWHKVQQWPDGLLKRLVATGVLVKALEAESTVCTACPNHCYMDVITRTSPESQIKRAFIVCNDIDMQDEMGRINIPLDDLQQWKTSFKQLAKVVAKLLALDYQSDRKSQPTNIRLGMLSSKQGRRWVSLNAKPLSLEVNQRHVPVDEVLYFEGDELLVDRPRINKMLVAAPLREGKGYIPSTSKREAGKRDTDAMHQDWNDAYQRLKRQHPDKKKRWICDQIALMPIAQNKKASTIYRVIKE